MKLLFRVVGSTKPITIIVPSEMEARIQWNEAITLGLYVPDQKRFIAPWQIKTAQVVDE